MGNIRLVIQYDAPPTVSAHIHRVGRCVRREQDEAKAGVAVSLVAPQDDEAYRAVRAACYCDDFAQKVAQLKFINTRVYDQLIQLMSVVGEVQGGQEELRSDALLFRRLQSGQALLDDDGDGGGADAYERAAEMINDLRQRKENRLGRYYQELCRGGRPGTVDAEDLRGMAAAKRAAVGRRVAELRALAQRYTERLRGQPPHGDDLVVFGQSFRAVSVAKWDPGRAGLPRQQGGEPAREAAPRQARRAEESRDRVITAPVVVDPLSGLARDGVAEPRAAGRLKRTYDALKKKDADAARRRKPENALDMASFRRLAGDLAGEVDADFMSFGPKEQRVKRLDRYAGRRPTGRKIDE